MRKLTYKAILENDLMSLKDWKFAILQIQSELETLDAEYAAVKATSFDKMPSGSGDNLQEEKLVTAIAQKDQKEAELKFNKLRVADMERLLEQLPDDERRIIDRMVINQEKYAVDSLSEELGYERRQIYNKKTSALMRLAQLRHGASYQP